MNFFVLLNTKDDILKKVCNQAVLGHHWLFIDIEKNTMIQNCRFPHSSEYLPLCSAEQTLIQVWNYLRMSKWQNFYFWVNCPFKCKPATLLPFSSLPAYSWLNCGVVLIRVWCGFRRLDAVKTNPVECRVIPLNWIFHLKNTTTMFRNVVILTPSSSVPGGTPTSHSLDVY